MPGRNRPALNPEQLDKLILDGVTQVERLLVTSQRVTGSPALGNLRQKRQHACNCKAFKPFRSTRVLHQSLAFSRVVSRGAEKKTPIRSQIRTEIFLFSSRLLETTAGNCYLRRNGFQTLAERHKPLSLRMACFFLQEQKSENPNLVSCVS